MMVAEGELICVRRRAKLYTKDKKKNIILFGVGKRAEQTIETLQSYSISINCCIDNDPQKQGQKFNGLLIRDPRIVEHWHKSSLIILVTSMHFSEIAAQLKAMGLEEDRHFFDVERVLKNFEIPLTRHYLDKWIKMNVAAIGDYTYGNPIIMWWGESACLTIGKFCSIADGVTIFLGGNHRTDWVSTYPFTQWPYIWPETVGILGHPATRGDVKIGNDVWLGAACTILSGVTIGDGAIIGAGAMVTKNVDPYTIVAGNPARMIRKRFKDKYIDSLLKIRWWDWPDDCIKASIPFLLSGDIDRFIQYAEGSGENGNKA